MGADIAATALAESFRARKSDVMSDLEKKRKKKGKTIRRTGCRRPTALFIASHS